VNGLTSKVREFSLLIFEIYFWVVGGTKIKLTMNKIKTNLSILKLNVKNLLRFDKNEKPQLIQK
jgi:hypothetical protein